MDQLLFENLNYISNKKVFHFPKGKGKFKMFLYFILYPFFLLFLFPFLSLNKKYK